MKKLISLLVLVTTMSCSNEDQAITNDASKFNSASVLDGETLSYANNESFVNEYSELSNLKSEKEVQDWISKKGLESLLNTSNDSIEMKNDILSDSRIIYSDALRAIFNSESKVKIGGKIVWLNKRNFYLLLGDDIEKSSKELELVKDELEVYGKILNNSDTKINTVSSLTNRNVLPNENRSKTYVVGLPNDKRYVLDLFNETIVMNDQISSSKMYLRYTYQYKSCSFWRCTWKNDTTTPWLVNDGGNYLTSNNSYGVWSLFYLNSDIHYGQYTFLLANWNIVYPLSETYQYANFNVSGSVSWKYASSSNEYPVSISWY